MARNLKSEQTYFKVYNQETFLRKMEEIHGDRYDFSQAVYVKSMQKVKVICPMHGEFLARPNSLMYGSGCKQCAMEALYKLRELTQEEFEQRVNEAHNHKYDLSGSVYAGARNEVSVLCPHHGEFKTTAERLMLGKGCRKCANELIGDLKRITQDEFLSRMQSLFGDSLNFSKAVYKGSTSKVTVVCPKHGDYVTTPASLFGGHGCTACYKERQGDALRHSQEQVLQKFKAVHGDKYDYSQVAYSTAVIPIKIGCKRCGRTFSQVPNAHSSGSGCPFCCVTGFSRDKPSVIYVIEIFDGKYIPLTGYGITGNFNRRLSTHASNIHRNNRCVTNYAATNEIPGDVAAAIERKLKDTLPRDIDGCPIPGFIREHTSARHWQVVDLITKLLEEAGYGHVGWAF